MFSTYFVSISGSRYSPAMWIVCFFILHYIKGISYIQIKICAEYRDMLPRPRLACQEPGSRSPGVPNKSSRGLGSMSRNSAQILIWFIPYIFQLFIPLWVWLATLQDWHYAQCPLLLSFSSNQNEAGHQTIKAPSMPCWGAAGPSKHTLAFMPQTGEIYR